MISGNNRGASHNKGRASWEVHQPALRTSGGLVDLYSVKRGGGLKHVCAEWLLWMKRLNSSCRCTCVFVKGVVGFNDLYDLKFA